MLQYKGYEIDRFINGSTMGFVVDYAGDEVFFDTVEEAMEFIDSLE